MSPANRMRVLLALVALPALAYQIRYTIDCAQILADPGSRAAAPFEVQLFGPVVDAVTSAAQAAGIRGGDRLRAIAGQPYTGRSSLSRPVAAARPGDVLPVEVEREGERRAIGVPLEVFVPQNGLAMVALTGVFSPLVCLALGFAVAALRPRDSRAWILLLLMLGFSQIGDADQVAVAGWSTSPLPAIWRNALAAAWPLGMVLFALAFPERLALDRRRPGLKWLVVVPLLAHVLFYVTRGVVAEHAVHLGPRVGHLYRALHVPDQVLVMASVSLFFAVMGMRRGMAAGDAHRRLDLLLTGAYLSLTPLGLVVAVALVRGSMDELPRWVVVPSLAVMVGFPLTLAYVIVVHQALDVKVVLRQGLRYALATRTLQVLKGLVTVGAVAVLFGFAVDPGANRPTRIRYLASAVLAYFLIDRVGTRLRDVIDRRFFRQAVATEQVLVELGEAVHAVVGTERLVEMVSDRVAESLGVKGLVTLLARDSRLAAVHARGFPAPPPVSISAHGAVADRLRLGGRALRIYLDDPESWVHRMAGGEERDALQRMEAQVLVPLLARDRLLGLLSLGPRRSEEPYSPDDVRLLQSVAGQAALALENSRLTEAVAAEVARRERMNREIEIAREVQEGLFPRTRPAVPGLLYDGTCRPARGVGGDYFDFLSVGSTLGIAVGDVSGKGIPASLLMACMQASLRAQTLDEPRDLTSLMERMNRLIHDASPANRYATFIYAQYEPRTRRLVYVNAGHLPPMLLRGSEVLRLEAGGPVIGLLPVASYTQGEVVLQPGDLLVAYSDGISEAMNAADEEWGEDRLLTTLRTVQGRAPADVIQRVVEAVDLFVGGAPQHDDMTLVVLRAD